MIRNLYSVFAAIALVSTTLLTSCSSTEDAVTSGGEEKKAFRASTEDATRTMINGTSISWQAGDKILINTYSGKRGVYKAVSSGSSTDFVYEKGDVIDPDNDGPFGAYFPASIKEGLVWDLIYKDRVCSSNGYSKFDEYLYEVGSCLNPYQEFVPGGFDPLCFHMVGVSKTANINFKNLFGILNFRLSSTVDDFTLHKITIGVDKSIFRDSTFINVDTEGNVEYWEPNNSWNNDMSYITLCNINTKLTSAPQDFYIVMPALNYSVCSVKLMGVDGSGAPCTRVFKMKTSANIDVTRSTIQDISLTLNSVAPGTQASVSSLTWYFGRSLDMSFSSMIKYVSEGHSLGTAPMHDNQWNYKNDLIKKVKFLTNSSIVSQYDVSGPESDAPLYATFNSSTGEMTLSTPAASICVSDGGSLFYNLNALEEVEGLENLIVPSGSHGLNFYYCENLTSIKFPVFNMPSTSSFLMYCTALTTVDMSDVTSSASYNSYMFRYTPNLSTVKFGPDFYPSSIKSMFYYTNPVTIYCTAALKAKILADASNIPAGKSVTWLDIATGLPLP